MALNIKNPVVEALAAEISKITGETKTEAIRRALEERKHRLSFRLISADRGRRLQTLLETEVWPLVPEDELGRRLTKDEEERLLGLGPEGA